MRPVMKFKRGRSQDSQLQLDNEPRHAFPPPCDRSGAEGRGLSSLQVEALRATCSVVNLLLGLFKSHV